MPTRFRGCAMHRCHFTKRRIITGGGGIVELPVPRSSALSALLKSKIVKALDCFESFVVDDLQKSKSQLADELKRLHMRIAELESTVARLQQTEQELGRAEERFHKVFDHCNDAIFLVDPERDEILDVNARACEMLGYGRGELLSVPMSAVHPHEMDKVKAFSQLVFKEGKGWTDELTCLTKPGKTLSAEMSASIIEIDGQPTMIALVRDTTERDRLTQENVYLRDEVLEAHAFGDIIGQSSSLKNVLQQIELVAPTEASVLILGESGTGKELVAREIHRRSLRKDRPMITVNCASIPRELYESEFFGHVQGAFTGAVSDRAGRFELADGGTLFLDEVGEIPLALQSKLLRVLQEGEFERVGDERTHQADVRIIAATNRDLKQEIEAKRFREDLYYRLNVFPLEIAPLRERKEDIAVLAAHFVDSSARKLNRPLPRLTQANILGLQRYDWPGNIRELQNVIERAVITASAGRLRFDLPTDTQPKKPGPADAPQSTKELAIIPDDEMRRRERDNILTALKRTKWKLSGDNGAAELLRIKPTTLASRMKKMGIERPV